MEFLIGLLVGVFATAAVFGVYFRKAITSYAEQEAAKAEAAAKREVSDINARIRSAATKEAGKL